MTLLCLTTRGWCGIGRSRSRSTSARVTSIGRFHYRVALRGWTLRDFLRGTVCVEVTRGAQVPGSGVEGFLRFQKQHRTAYYITSTVQRGAIGSYRHRTWRQRASTVGVDGVD